MRISFRGILSATVALEAVKRNGYALQYVVNVKLFIKIAAMLGIKTAGVPDEVET